MDEMCNLRKQSVPSPNKKKVILVALGVAIFCLAGVIVWDKYFSFEVRHQKEEQAKVDAAMQYVADIQQKLREDTYGGKTPEETIAMFADALERGDVDLAVKYVYESEGVKSSIGRREEFKNAILKAQEEGKISSIVNALRNMKESAGGIKNLSAFFEYKDNTNEYYLSLFFNDFSEVWKIENL